MAAKQITTAIQKGSFVYVYSGNSVIQTLSGELQGYTSTTVSVKKGSFIYVYNASGSVVSTHSAR